MPEENKQENNTISRESLIEQAFCAILLMSDEQVEDLLERWEKLSAEHSDCIERSENLSDN